MMKKRQIPVIFIAIFVLFSIIGCKSQWKIDIYNAGVMVDSLTKEDVSFYIEKSTEPVEVIPLGQMLYASGFTLVEEISLHDQDGVVQNYTWDDIAAQSTISERGEVFIDNESLHPNEIDVLPSPLAKEISYSIMDISPTVANALGLPELPKAVGQPISSENNIFDHAVMILLDGTQYNKLNELIEEGKLPFLASQNSLMQGISIYPPITTSASAALLTGTPPLENGVFGYGYRSTELTTLFDLASENGRTAIAIEGISLPFNLRNAESTLSGDQDGNGFSDDNVFANSVEVIQSQMPDLLYIHFHEIDDMGHTYGPESTEYASALIRVDGYLSQIVKALPANTFIAIFADHGMHATADGGNHGTLMSNDLIIPILFITK